MGRNKFNFALDYINGQDHEKTFEGEKASNGFHAMPGALSLEEVVEKIDLGKWRLKLGQRVVRLEVKITSKWSILIAVIADALNRILLAGIKSHCPIRGQSKASRQN